MSKRIGLIKILTVAVALCFAISGIFMISSMKTANADAVNIEINGQTVDISSFRTYGGASIRYDDVNGGIRFITGIDETIFNQINQIVDGAEGYSVRFGTILTYTDFAQSTVDNAGDYTIEALESLDKSYMNFSADVFRTTPDVVGNKEYTAVLNVAERNYNEAMTARGYMVINDGTNEKYYYADYEFLNSSATSVAHALMEDFRTYGVDNNTEIKAIAKYTNVEGEDCFNIKDSSALITATANSTDSTLTYDQSIGGRSGAIKYTLNTASKSWAERVAPAFSASFTSWTGTGDNAAIGHQNAFNRQNFMGINYVVFDVYVESSFGIYFPTENRTHAQALISASGNITYKEKDTTGSYIATTDTKYSDCIKVFNEGGTKELTATYSGLWYVVVVDVSCNIGLGHNSSCDVVMTTTVEGGTIYFDNVRYYRNDAWKQDIVKDVVAMDDSAFDVIYTGDGTLTVGSAGGRDNVQIFNTKNGSPRAQAGFVFSTMYDANNNAIASTANKRMEASGVKYITFDACKISNGTFTMYVWDGSKYSALSLSSNVTGAIKQIPSTVKIFDADGNAVTDTLVQDTWYTIVIEVKYATGANWPTIKFDTAWLNIAIDNVNYYYNGTPELLG